METPMTPRAAPRPMQAATRVRVAPSAPLGEEALLHAARAFTPPGRAVRPGDAVGDLVVLAVEPKPGATLVGATEVEIVPAVRRRDAPRLDVAILLDIGESMGVPWDKDHTRLEAALVAVRSFLAKPSPALDSVSVLYYGAQPHLMAGPTTADALRDLPPARPRGPSDTAAGIDGALAALAARTRPGVSQVILLFTDGVGDVPALLAAAERAGRLQVQVHCLVFAPEVDEAFERLTRAAGGTVQQAAHPLTLEFVHDPRG